MRGSFAAAMLTVTIAASALLAPAALAQPATQNTADNQETGNVIVRFRGDATLGEVAGALDASDTTAIKTTTLDDIALVAPSPGADTDDAISALESDASVLYAEPDYRVTIDAVPNDTNYGSQWHYPKIGLPAAWDVTTGSASVIVAVVDTGVELTDPELDSKITSGANAGYDFANSDTDPTDDHGHGTHVAGTIAAETNNATGVAGVCWACKIMPVKVLDNTGNGSTLDVAAGIDWARTHGAKVVNLSLGSLQSSVTLQTAVNNASNAGLVVVGAAGNNAGNADTSDDTVMFPGAYPNAIGVGATDSSDVRASFSNYGPELDVMAPGVSILSTVMGAGYGSWSGTSMATPHVSGAAALLASAGITDPATIRARLTSTAADLGAPGFDNLYGYGRINVNYALDQTNPTVSVTAPANGATVGGASVAVSANASDALAGVQKVRFTFDGGSPVDDTTAPYGINWNSTGYSDGSHSITAQATDNAGNSSSHTINVAVSNADSTPPTVNITAPSAGATVSGTVTLTATASDVGGIQKVRFWAGSTYLGYDTTAPYSKSWNTTAGLNGKYTIRAEAVDNASNTASQSISVTVINPDSTPPSVSITSPTDGGTVSGTVSFDASASDTQGLQKVQFWVDTAYLGYDSAAAYSKSWDTTMFVNGTHLLRARAIDWANNWTEATITVTVNNADAVPPTASITSPLNGTTVSGTITITASASDNVGVQKVRFWVDSTYLSYDTSSPYTRSWDSTSVTNGSHTIRVQAVDLANNVSSDDTITINVSN
jgi:subtilisin family serine protease